MTKIQKYVLNTLFFTVICIPIFLKLDMLPIQMWDESRNAIAAMEMMNNEDWFVRHYTHGRMGRIQIISNFEPKTAKIRVSITKSWYKRIKKINLRPFNSTQIGSKH
jgi:hypothetical protein